MGGQSGTIDRALIYKVLRLLEGLKGSASGDAVYSHVSHLLNEAASLYSDVERAYASIVYMLLDAYAARVPPGSPLQVQLKLLQQHLQPPLTVSELQVLRNYVETYSAQIVQLEEFNDDSLREVLEPLLGAFGAEAAEIPRKRAPEAREEAPAPAPPSEGEAEAEHFAERRVDLAYRRYLDAKREDLRKLQAALARQIGSAIAQSEEFGVLLEVELNALKQAESREEIEELRSTLVDEIEKLIGGHRKLTEKLDGAGQYLNLIETDAQSLKDELSRVRTLSLTDELTDLPNRRALLRQLEDEVNRARRFGNPLCMALMDLDHFKQINDAHGHAAGDEVLRCYAHDILTMFRKHDFVARFGGEEFAVLMPNTDTQGALCALAKIQQRAKGMTRYANQVEIPIPSFSAGVGLYSTSESMENFIKRVDNALYLAKRRGRNRVEVIEPEEPKAEEEAPHTPLDYDST